MPRYLRRAKRGRSKHGSKDRFMTSPAAPILKVAWHFLDRRVGPSSEEGHFKSLLRAFFPDPFRAGFAGFSSPFKSLLRAFFPDPFRAGFERLALGR
jgi:hypothetical protein